MFYGQCSLESPGQDNAKQKHQAQPNRENTELIRRILAGNNQGARNRNDLCDSSTG